MADGVRFVRVDGCVFLNNVAGNQGSAVAVTTYRASRGDANIEVLSSDFIGNQRGYGVVAVVGTDSWVADLQIEGSRFSGNRSGTGTAGLYLTARTFLSATILSTRFEGNVSGGTGGVLDVGGPTGSFDLEIGASDFFGNVALSSGVLHETAGGGMALQIRDSRFEDNLVSDIVPAIELSSDEADSSAQFSKLTFHRNGCLSSGGGSTTSCGSVLRIYEATEVFADDLDFGEGLDDNTAVSDFDRVWSPGNLERHRNLGISESFVCERGTVCVWE